MRPRRVGAHGIGFKLRIPIFGGLGRKVAISRFARTFSVLSRTGVPVLQALDIVAQTSGNTTVSDAILDVHNSVKRGESLAAPLARHDVFPPMVTHMMSVGEETGALDTIGDVDPGDGGQVLLYARSDSGDWFGFRLVQSGAEVGRHTCASDDVSDMTLVDCSGTTW